MTQNISQRIVSSPVSPNYLQNMDRGSHVTLEFSNRETKEYTAKKFAAEIKFYKREVKCLKPQNIARLRGTNYILISQVNPLYNPVHALIAPPKMQCKRSLSPARSVYDHPAVQRKTKISNVSSQDHHRKSHIKQVKHVHVSN
jgi:hypothetical protein